MDGKNGVQGVRTTRYVNTNENVIIHLPRREINFSLLFVLRLLEIRVILQLMYVCTRWLIFFTFSKCSKKNTEFIWTTCNVLTNHWVKITLCRKWVHKNREKTTKTRSQKIENRVFRLLLPPHKILNFNYYRGNQLIIKRNIPSVFGAINQFQTQTGRILINVIPSELPSNNRQKCTVILFTSLQNAYPCNNKHNEQGSGRPRNALPLGYCTKGRKLS